MPATIGISAASATSFSIEPSNAPMTREATNAVTRLIASHAQRFFTESITEAKMSSSSRRPAWRPFLGFRLFADEIDHGCHGDPPDQTPGVVDHRRRYQVVALESLRRRIGLVVRVQHQRIGQHQRCHVGLGLRDEHPIQRQHAAQMFLAVDDEELVGVIGQLIEAAQIAQALLLGLHSSRTVTMSKSISAPTESSA